MTPSETTVDHRHSDRSALDVRAADALLTTGALQTAIFNSANFSSIATDARGVIQIFNVGAERMLGYTAAEVVNTITPADISDPHELILRASALSKELSAAITPGFEALVFKASRGIEDIYELTYIRKDGSRFPAVVSVTALRDANDVIIGYLLIGTDNTARKQIEDERKRFERTLQQKNVELEDASRMKSEFLANMSHELRTPLNAIIGFSEVLGDGLMGSMTDQQRGYVGDIFRAGKHLLSLINDILDLSKVEAGKMMLDLNSTPVSSLLTNSLSIVKGQAATRRVQLNMILPEELGAIEADTRKVKQIVYNLLSNAVKFSDEGGNVTLEAARVSRDQVGASCDGWHHRRFPLAASDFAEFLMISVKDNGIGISSGALESLFKPFTQVESGLARKFEGTGLGLVMVKLLAELHGGTVAVESAEGRGSCFTVWLPFRAATAEQRSTLKQAPALPTTTPRANAPTALVVEDDKKSAELIRLQLEAEGFVVLHAETADKALHLAQHQPLSLITLNVMLPGVDGWEFLRKLKDIPDLHRIPVVIISILADRAKGFALGAAAVMQKPIAREELFDLLVELGLSPQRGKALTVLVVDDDPTMVELTSTRLSQLGATVLRAGGGREAIEIASKAVPDLIVLDLMMPEVNGFDVVQALSTQPHTNAIPIIVITSKDITPEDRARLSGFVRTIMKKSSFGGARLGAEVRRAMAVRSGAE